jgi:hypothetical protein
MGLMSDIIGNWQRRNKMHCVDSASCSFGKERLKGATPQFTLSFIDSDSIGQEDIPNNEWNQLAESSENLYAFYQSPIWLGYSLHTTLQDYILRLNRKEKPIFVCFHDVGGRLAGAIPAQKSQFPLIFRFRTRNLLRVHFNTVKILGGQPLIRDEENLYVDFVKSLFATFPDCDFISMQHIPVGSYCWNIAKDSKELRKCADVYFPNDSVLHPRVTLRQSFKEYLQKFKSKTRYNLQRQVRQLRDHGGGQLDLIRIEHTRDVKTFLEDAATISKLSWQDEILGPEMIDSPFEHDQYARLAEKGVLRSYVLRCGNTPCAFVRGFQHGNVFYYSRIGFDKRFTDFSPGTVCLYLVIGDLHAYRPSKYINFQEGLWDYKKLFMTDCQDKIDVLFIRKDARLSSKILISMHQIYQASLFQAKKIISRKSSK